MADTERKFSELSVAATLTDNDILALSQTDIGTSTLISVRATLIAIATHIAKVAAFTNDLDTTSKTLIGAINELKQLISLIPQFSIDVVQTLPVSDISETTIYLVPSSDPEQGNYYEEYIYVNNTWELVGTTAVDLSAYYTKLEVDTLLAAKANTSDVTAALALKEAKADMDDDVTDIVVALTDEQTTTPGNPVTLTTEQSGGAKSAVVTFTPKQSGSGDPSPDNVRPISGWTELNLTRTGKNLLAKPFVYDDSVGFNLTDYFFIKAGTYIFAFDTISSTSWRYVIRMKDKNGDDLSDEAYNPLVNFQWSTSRHGWINRTNITNKTCALTFVTDCYIRITFAAGDTSASTTVTKAQLELGSTATTYEPYQGETHTATFDNTVYGGQLDFVSGKLSVNYAYVDLGTLNWQMATHTQTGIVRFQANASGLKGSGDNQTPCNMMCTIYKNDSWANVVGVENDKSICGLGTTGGVIAVQDSDYNSAETFKTAMSGVKLCYELATTTEITITPEDIELLKGSNTVWSDANGTVTVGYAKLPNGNLGAVVDYIKKLEARIAALES